MTQAAANRYVSALADIVAEPATAVTLEETLDQLEAFGELLEESSELDSLLRSPAVAPREKRELVDSIAARIGLARVVRNFLCVVIDNRRIGDFHLFVTGFRAWLDRLRRRAEIEVRTASPVTPGQKQALERQFRRLTGMQLRPTYVLDPNLIGGMSVQVGSTLFDGSLRASLGSLASSLASGSR